ncbi:hypothetical protein SUGI_0207680 [Cryptomeria japonica]|nr:hypothetical protein SUGI_0207680 [Cryptomeria japonica]
MPKRWGFSNRRDCREPTQNPALLAASNLEKNLLNMAVEFLEAMRQCFEKEFQRRLEASDAEKYKWKFEVKCPASHMTFKKAVTQKDQFRSRVRDTEWATGQAGDAEKYKWKIEVKCPASYMAFKKAVMQKDQFRSRVRDTEWATGQTGDAEKYKWKFEVKCPASSMAFKKAVTQKAQFRSRVRDTE